MSLLIRYKPKTRIEQLIALISIYSALHKIQVSDTNITLMACLVQYGINNNTREFVINRMKLFKTLGQYRNGLTALRNAGLLTKEEHKHSYKIIKDLSYEFNGNGDIDIAIKLEKATLNEKH